MLHNLPENKYRPVKINDRDEVLLWHKYEDDICLENTGDSYDRVLQSKHNDDEKYTLLREIRDDQMHDYGKRFIRYFIISDDEIAGTFAIPLDISASKFILIESLYVLKKFRSKGLCKELFNDLMDFSYSLSLDGIRLQTEYHWSKAISFYLHNGFWLLHWNDSLNFIKHKTMPEYQIDLDSDWLHFSILINDSFQRLISVRNDTTSLYWEEHNESENIAEEILLNAVSTLSLHLALRDWPLIRSGSHKWQVGDCGGPEALARQLAFWQAPISELAKWKPHVKELKRLEKIRRLEQ